MCVSATWDTTKCSQRRLQWSPVNFFWIKRQYEYANKIRGKYRACLNGKLYFSKAYSPYSRNNCTTCLRTCSKEGFKVVSISIAIMNTCDHYNYVKTKAFVETLKTYSRTCPCDPYNLYKDKALRRLRSDLLNPKFGSQKSALL